MCIYSDVLKAGEGFGGCQPPRMPLKLKKSTNYSKNTHSVITLSIYNKIKNI